MILISVIMSVFNEAIEILEESINSILHQSLKDFEFIIVCDNVKNFEIIKYLERKALEDERIKLIYNNENIGLTKSLNKALRMSSGRYIARMDADDISCDNRFEIQLEYLNRNHLDACGCWAECFGDEFGFIKHCSEPNEIDIETLFRSPMVHPTLFAKSVVMKSNEYDSNFVVSQDYELWSRLIISGYRLGNVPETLLRYRMSNKQITSKKEDLQLFLSNKIKNSYAINKVSIKNVSIPKSLHASNLTLTQFKRNLCFVTSILSTTEVSDILKNVISYYTIKMACEIESCSTSICLYCLRNILHLSACKIMIILIIRLFKLNRLKVFIKRYRKLTNLICRAVKKMCNFAL